MPVILNDDLPIHVVSRIKTRILVGRESGAQETAVWEQWIDPDGFIPLHYHEVEEVLVLLTGEVALTQDAQATDVRAPATIVIPPFQVHGLRPAALEQVHLLAFFPTASPTIVSPDGSLRPLPWHDVSGGEKPP